MEDKKEILINTQITFFFKDRLLDPGSFSSEMKVCFPAFNNSTDELFPVPDDIRFDDIPIVSASSSDNVYRYEIAKGRINFYIAGEGKQSFSDKEKDLAQDAEKLYNLLQEKDKKIKRFGFVTRFFIEDINKDEVIEKILNPSFIKIHKDISTPDKSSFYEGFIRYVRKTEFLSLSINNYSTIERFNARISGVQNNLEGILITRDLNTAQENEEKNSETLNNKFSMKLFIDESKNRFQLDEIKKILYGK